MTSSRSTVFNRICRTCLNADGELLPIFSKGQHVSNLPKKIMASIHFKISEDDELPKMMCKKCIFLADSFYCFKQQCESANEKLKKFYKMMTEGNLGAHYGMDEYINHNIYGGPFELDTRYKTNKENINSDNAYDSEDEYFVEYISEEVRIEVENALKRKRDARRKVNMERLSEIIKNLEDVEVVPVSTCRAISNSRGKNTDKQDIVVFPLKKLSSTNNIYKDVATRNQRMNLMKRKISSSCAPEKRHCHGEKKNKVSSIKDDSKCSNDVNFTETGRIVSVKDHPIKILAIDDTVSNNIVMDQNHIGETHNQVTVGMEVCQTNDTTQDTAMPIQIVQEKGIGSRAKQREHGLQLSILEGNEETNNKKEQSLNDSETILHEMVDGLQKNPNDKAEKEKLNFHLETDEDHVQAFAGEFKTPKSLASVVNDVDEKKSTIDMYSKTDDTVDIIYMSNKENSEDDITKEEGLRCLTNVTDKEETNVSEDNRDFKTIGEAKECQEVYPIEEVRKKEEFLVIADLESQGTKLKILDGNLNLYQCTICKSNFASMPTVLKHNIQEHMTSQNDYSCLICKKVFKDKSLLIIHVEQHSDFKSYRCSFCPKSFTLKKDLKKHVNHHFNEKSVLSTHRSVHSSNPSFICPTCDLAFSSESKRDTHLATMHDQCATITCEYCKTQFPKKLIAKVDGKVDDVHGSCDKKLSQQSCSKTQLIDQTLLCPSCDKPFGQKKIRHDRPSTHASAKLYKYNECSASSTDSSALKRHVALYTKKLLTLYCNKCKKKFVNVHELRKHLRVRHRKFSRSKEDSLSENAKEIADANGEPEKKSKIGQDVTCNRVQLDVAGSDSQGKSERYDQNDDFNEETQPPVASEMILE